jgi:membrane protease YdiL (CAAX protease family)
VLHKIFTGANGLRAGWRLLIYGALVFALGYLANKIADATLHGWQPDPGNAANGIGFFLVAASVLLVAGWILARIERRSLADYGLPWRRAFCGQFWQAWVIAFVSFTAILAVLSVARSYSLGSMQLHGAEILQNALLWAAAMTLAPIFEEFFYRGDLQFTLTGGIGFWPAALVTSALMGAAHTLNPGWRMVGVMATRDRGWSGVCCCAGRAICGCRSGCTPDGIGAKCIFTACRAADSRIRRRCSGATCTVRCGLQECRTAWKRAG